MESKKLKVVSMTLGLAATNCYFVFDDSKSDEDGKKHGIFFDPADKGELIYEKLSSQGYAIDLILLTHGHFDHIGGCEALKKLTNAKIGCYEKEQALCNDLHLNVSNYFGVSAKIVPDILYNDQDYIEAAGIKCKLLATPGHTSGSCCYYFEDAGILISGDTLFEESVGRTDFPTGSTSMIVNSIRDKLFVLPENTLVYPGHGEMTTIGHEMEYNPFC